MKKFVKVMIVLFALFLLFGCTRPVPADQKPAEEQVVKEDKVVEETIPPSEEKKEAPVEATPEERKPGPEPEKKQETELREMSPELKKLLETADRKITSFSYYPTIAPEYRQRDLWNVRGNKVRIDLFQEKSYQEQNYFDTVYLDMEKETALAYCLGNNARCGISAHYHPFKVSYDSFKLMTPYEWVKSIDNGEIVQTETLGKIITKVVHFVREGETCEIWIGEFSGLALKVKCKDEKPKVVFQDLAVNNVMERYVNPPSKP